MHISKSLIGSLSIVFALMGCASIDPTESQVQVILKGSAHHLVSGSRTTIFVDGVPIGELPSSTSAPYVGARLKPGEHEIGIGTNAIVKRLSFTASPGKRHYFVVSALTTLYSDITPVDEKVARSTLDSERSSVDMVKSFQAGRALAR